MKKLLSVLFMLLVVFSLAGCGGTSKTTIKIGSSGPLSGSASVYGQSVKEGMDLAVEEINKNGGIKINDVMMPLELVDFVNDDADPDKAGAALATLVNNGVDVVIGAVTSGATEGLISEAIKVGVPVLTPTGTADKLTVGEKGDERDARYNVFRACFYDSYQGIYMANYVTNLGYKKAYVLFNNDEDYSVGLKDAFVKQAALNGITVKEVGYDKQTKDFNSAWSKVLVDKYECVYVPDYYENVYNIVKTGYQLGYTGKCFGGDGWDGVLSQIKPTDDTKFLENCFYSNHYCSSSNEEKVKSFVTKYKEKYGQDKNPTSFAALTYDAVYIVKQAMESCNSYEYEDVIKALETLEFKNLVTSGNGLKFDENGNPKKSVSIITFKDGKEIEFKK